VLTLAEIIKTVVLTLAEIIKTDRLRENKRELLVKIERKSRFDHANAS
jgi:hypothetical protein